MSRINFKRLKRKEYSSQIVTCTNSFLLPKYQIKDSWQSKLFGRKQSYIFKS